TTQMLERGRLLIRDGAGAGKTAPVIKAKLALEQLVLDGEKINPIIVCPNFVLSSWEAKLREYLEDRQEVLTITSGSRKEAIEKFEKGIADGTLGWTLISYDALFRTVDNKTPDDIAHEIARLRREEPRITDDQVTLADRILSAVETSQEQMMLCLDESHNAKNPEALRSKAVRKLALGADRFYAMTGNPFPDNLDDIGELASLLDPENFPTAENFKTAYEGNPRLIRLFLRRFSKEPVTTFRNLPGVPKVNINPPTYLSMSPDEERLYWSVLDHKEFGMGRKFVLTRLAATDGTLLLPENHEGKSRRKMEEFFQANPGLLEATKRIDSTKYKELDKLVKEAVEKGEKIVIWTKLRNGITERLEQRYAEHGSIRIDGTVSSDPGKERYSERDKRRLEFQTNPDKRVLVASIDSIREGQDLHAANNCVFIMRDFSPGLNDQAIGRIARRGQQKEVNVHTLIMGGTVEQGIYEDTEEIKRAGIEEAEGGRELSEEQKEALAKKKPIVAQTPIKRYMMNARSQIRMMSGHMLNKGSEKNRTYLAEGDHAQIYAQAYNFKWESSYSAHTARLIEGLVREIEGKEGSKLEKIIDLGSPATVSRKLRRPSLCVDINPHQLKIGKREAEALGIGVETLVADIEDLSKEVKSREYDLAVLSLVLHYGNSENGGRKRMALETSRIIRPGGYGIITLPSKLVEETGSELLQEGLRRIGLEPVPERTGVVKAIDGLSDKYEVYVTVVKKTHDNPPASYKDRSLDRFFILSSESLYSNPGNGDIRESGKNSPQGYREELCTQFQFVNNGAVISSRKAQRPSIEPAQKTVRTPEEIVSIIEGFMTRRRGGK
ncbi:MAG: SNF2-related protein, partial [Nanoarchaeota archaeon]